MPRCAGHIAVSTGDTWGQISFTAGQHLGAASVTERITDAHETGISLRTVNGSLGNTGPRLAGLTLGAGVTIIAGPALRDRNVTAALDGIAYIKGTGIAVVTRDDRFVDTALVWVTTVFGANRAIITI